MACPSFTKLPMEMNFSPWGDSIGKITPSTTFGLPREPSITGMEEPCTSASRISTECPALSSAPARFTATVLLPTPPLPLTTAMMRVLDSSRKAGASSEGPPCREVSRFCRSSSVITPKSTSTLPTPSISFSRSLMSVVILCFKGQPAVVRATPTVTPGPSISMLRIMFSDTRSRPISGSLTSLSASRIPASENPSAGSSSRGVRSTSSSAVSVSTRTSAAPFDVSSLPVRLRNQSTTSANLLRHYRPAISSSLKERKTPCFGQMLPKGKGTQQAPLQRQFLMPVACSLLPSNRPIFSEDPAQRIRDFAQCSELCQGYFHRIDEVIRAFRGASQVGQRVLDGCVVSGLPELPQTFGLAVSDGFVDRMELHVGVVGAFRRVVVYAHDDPLSLLHLPLIAVGGVLDLKLHKALLDGPYRAPELVDAPDVVPRFLLDRVGQGLDKVGAGQRIGRISQAAF